MTDKFLLKAFQLGLGVVDLTKEEMRKAVKELNIDANTKEGRKLVDKLMKEGEVASKKLEKKVEKHAKKFASNFVTKKDLERVEKKIDSLLKKKK